MGSQRVGDDWATELNWTDVPFTYFCFYFHYSRRWWVQKDLALIYVSVLPLFSSKRFITSGLTFTSLIRLSLFLCISLYVFTWSFPLLKRTPVILELYKGLPWWLRNMPVVQETRVWSLSQEDPLEKGMATHSSILAWRIPWTEEPSRVAKSRAWLRN